ncbi:glycoside hydrolase family 15 protein [Bacillus sp. FJAT-27245]|uniref:glycoside hydrolase family 15 protein n=1 Tax=Bacillus sp. FJAT-27245 TaxID=1684144 RepID=UPI0006A766EE|nr:glycoside hydrolase family 15 protein [Bacillus sp. FJAT-27245]
MRKKPYLTDAIIGNSKMLATLTKDGQLQRLYWPNIDFPQHANRFYTGIHIDDGEDGGTTSFIHEDGWEHLQSYENDTNILVTTARNFQLKIEITQTDFVVPGKDIFVRDYQVTNLSSSPNRMSFVMFSDFTVDDRKRYSTVMFNPVDDCLVHYFRQYAFAVGSSIEASQYQSGAALEAARVNKLSGKVIMNKTDGALSWELGDIAGGEKKRLTVYISAGSNLGGAVEGLAEAKKLGPGELHGITSRYWKEYLLKARQIDIEDAKVRNVYNRSLLTFKLLNDEETGAFIAGPEVDEDYDYSGGYAYCWGRDAAYIATAADVAGYHDLVSKFYYSTMATQREDGAWEHRFYTNGMLAPTWGIQIDECGSILWGIHKHYEITSDDHFLNMIWPSVEKGANYLTMFIDLETNLPLPTNDLWEKREGEHLYSTAAVYGGLVGSAKLARKLGRVDLAKQWEETAERMKKTVEERCWNDEAGSYLRALKLAVDEKTYTEATLAGKETVVEEDRKGYKTFRLMEDPVIDICLLGLNVPFEMIDENSERMRKTAETIERTLTSPVTGGLERFPGDVYIGGNPWILTTLWMALYDIKTGNFEKARAYLNWAVNNANHLGLLPEQIHKETGEPAWVMPLTWSHAMFVLTVIALEEAGELNRY